MPFEVETALTDPGFTPGVRHFSVLLDLLATVDDETCERIERVLARAGAAAFEPTRARLAAAPPELRRRLVRLLTRLPSSPTRTQTLLDELTGPDSVCRRWAARGLGQLPAPDEEVESALLGALDGADLPLQRAIAEALGKVGGPRSFAALAELSGDPELERRARRSRLLLERAFTRQTPSTIRRNAPLGVRFPMVARCRRGLAQLVAEELREFGARVTSPASVAFEHEGSLSDLERSRIALDFGVVVPPERPLARSPEGLAELITSPSALGAFRAWTDGPVRFRLAFGGGGHRRAEAWRVAELVAEKSRELVNDTREAPWEIVIPLEFERQGILLVPRDADRRFEYRVRDVPAASHPTLAAALARVAQVRPDDVVWDPFVGSALELIERARLGPYRSLLGSDIDPRALEAAHENLKSARIEARLERGDALSLSPRGVSLILTNPPMGRRVARDGSLRQLLTAFVERTRELLVPGGRLVWLSPLPEATARTGRRAGLRVQTLTTVDMQGFEAALQVFQRR